MSVYEFKKELALEELISIEETLMEIGDARWMVFEDKSTARAWLMGYFSSEEESHVEWQRLAAVLDPVDGDCPPETRELPDQEWRDSYKAHFKASQFGRLHWAPIWEKEQFVLPDGHEVLWLDPGLAFGTGNHETTRLVAERLVCYAERLRFEGSSFQEGNERRPVHIPRNADLRVVDAGCGSGILALSAARLGFKNIRAFDNDPEAVRVSDENAALNGLTGAAHFFVGDLDSGLAGEKADFLMANIQADVLIAFAVPLVRALSKEGTLVLSGILARELEKVTDVFQNLAPQASIDTRIMGEWSDLQLVLNP